MSTKKKLILGTVQMGLPYGIKGGGNLSYRDSEDILNAAIDHGITELDTAEVYGNAHQVIGKFHRSNKQHSFNIITKLPGNISEKIEKKVETYLDELGVEELEALMLHAFETLQDNPDILPQLQKLKKTRKIRNIGISIYTNEQLQYVIGLKEIDLIQLPFNLLDNFSLRGSLLERAKKEGKIIHTRSAFLQGLFFMDPESENKIVRTLRPQLLKLKEIAKKEEVGMASLALNYVLQQDFIDKVLIGVDNLLQFEENLAITGTLVSKESQKEIDRITVDNAALLNPSLWN